MYCDKFVCVFQTTDATIFQNQKLKKFLIDMFFSHTCIVFVVHTGNSLFQGT